MNRRTKSAMSELRDSLYEIVRRHQPMTVRQVFYQAVTRGLIKKSEAEYKQTVVRLLTEMRKSGELPWYWIADNSRWMRKPRTHSSLEVMLEESAKFYRRSLWEDQDAYVEVWLEKDALSGVLYDVTSQWDVPLMVTRGYPSFSFLAGAAEVIEDEAAAGKDVYLYYFGDYDPSGMDISRHVEEELGRLAAAEIAFERVAVNPEQIIGLGLQTRPTKKTDSRAKHFSGESVEVDAIEPSRLRNMAEECITRHLDEELYRKTLLIEEAERETLRTVAKQYSPAGG